MIRKIFFNVRLFFVIAFFVSCKEGITDEINSLNFPEARFGISRLITKAYPGTTIEDSIYCPVFSNKEQFYSIGDTLVIFVSQEFGYEIIGTKPVFVTVTSKLGDRETFLLKSGFWPCETRIVDFVIYRSIIFYNTKPLDYPASPFINNGLLEIWTGGDTLLAWYTSYSTGKVLYDTVVVLPK